jgi:L-2-hydroxyglutarate oxidase LhgO
MTGISIDQAGYRLHLCKGEYFRISSRHRNRLKHLVYPAPTKISLGVHGVLELDGSMRLGPNAFYVDGIDYSVDSDHEYDFFRNGRKMFPFIEEGDLTPDIAGIRPKIQTDKEDFCDFIIKEESARGLNGFINLIGIESPGLTSCLSIASYVEKLVRNI